MHLPNSSLLLAALMTLGGIGTGYAAPLYEHGYANDHLVTISVQDPHHGKVPRTAQNTYFEVSYPTGWRSLTTAVPICNPCDHGGDGDSLDDYHDHVFSGEPSAPGKGAYGPLWALTLVLPNYTGNTAQDAAISAAYAKFLPTTSSQKVLALLAATLPGTKTPLAVRVDIDYVFLAAIVNPHAAH